MAEQNTLAVQAVSPTVLSSMLRSTSLATSVRLVQLQRAIVTVSGGGPDFPAGQEPVQDAVAYTASDGMAFYRPMLRVAQRGPGRRPGPDVWFVEDDQGVITLQFTLEVIPLVGGPAGAMPLPFTVDSLRMVWNAGTYDFEVPGVEVVDTPTEGQSPLRIHAAARLRPDEAATLESAMNHHESACRLEIAFSCEYTVQVPEPTGPAGPSGPGGRRPRPRIPRPQRFPPAEVAFKPHIFEAGIAATRVSAISADAVATPHFGASDMIASGISASDILAAKAEEPVWGKRISRSVRDRLIGIKVSDIIAAPQTRPDARKVAISRSVPFVFEPSEEANGPIYRALHDAAALTDDWQQLGDAGWLRDSDFPNTIFRLPDALRLAWDAETGGPRMAPTLYRDTAGEPRVRLLLRLAPWQDPAKIVLTRRGLDMLSARVVTGQVGNSTLHMGGAFPEELTLVGAAGMSIPLAGAELAFDVSLSFYEFICQVVTSHAGLSGTVEVVVATLPDATAAPGEPGAAATQRSVPVPVQIRLDRVDDLPCTIAVPEGEVSPTTVTVTNASGADLTIGGCEASFLQIDEESVVPVDLYPARCTSTFPITLAAGARAQLTMEQETEADDVVWNGVLVELLDKRLVSPPADVLRKVHELAPAGASSRDLTITSPVFATGALPDKWAGLFSIEVELTTQGGQVLSGMLSLTNPSRTLHVPASLADLVSGVGGGIPTVAYRVRNNYVDHQGEWSAPQSQSGDEIVVYPNPA